MYDLYYIFGQLYPKFRGNYSLIVNYIFFFAFDAVGHRRSYYFPFLVIVFFFYQSINKIFYGIRNLHRFIFILWLFYRNIVLWEIKGQGKIGSSSIFARLNITIKVFPGFSQLKVSVLCTLSNPQYFNYATYFE